MQTVRKMAFIYAFFFIFVVVLGYIPGLTTPQGLLLGLYRIDPVDDLIHIISGVAALIAASNSPLWSKWYFKLVGVLFGLDALMGLIFQRGLLDLTIFTGGMGMHNFGGTNWLVNLPHIIVASIALFFGFWYGKNTSTKTRNKKK